jgi:hypothetical protein
MRRTVNSLWPGLGLLFLIPLLLGCPPYTGSGYISSEFYHVYYDGNRHTEGSPPVDSAAYFPGDTAVVLAKPEDLKKGDQEFLGWRQSGSDALLKEGDTIKIGYSHVGLIAWWADDPDYSPYEYAADPQNGGVVITRYSPYEVYGMTVTIPDTLDGLPVTAIGEAVFIGYYIKSIVLPSHLVVIGNKAFAGTGIVNIDIPDTVESIGKLAFQNCYLESISLGSGLKTIDDYAFDGNYLTALFLPESVTSVGDGAFSGNKLITIEIGGQVALKNDTSLGVYGASFRSYYGDQDSRAGVYLYNSGAWRGPYAE